MFNMLNPKITVTVASVLVIASMVGVLIVNSHAVPASSEVEGASTTNPAPDDKVSTATKFVTASNPNTSNPNPHTPAATSTVRTATASKRDTTAPTDTSSAETTPEQPTTLPATTQPKSEEPATTTPEAPSPTVPAPQPTFSIALHADQATSSEVVAGTHQVIVPFDIIFEPGFTTTSSEQPLCAFITAPVGHNVLCNVSQKEAGSGTLSLQYTDAAGVAGHYVVEVRYSLNGAVRTDTYAFDLITTPPATAPSV